jgi:hypothetical protein
MTPRATINVEYELGQALNAFLMQHGRPEAHRLAKFCIDKLDAMRTEMAAAAALAAGNTAESAESEAVAETAELTVESEIANG